MKDCIRRFVFDLVYYAVALSISGKIHWSDILKIDWPKEIYYIRTGEIRP